MKRTVCVVFVALISSTCNQASGPAPVESPEGVGLVALDLEPMAGALRAEARLPTRIDVLVDGQDAGTVTLPAPVGLLAGHATVPVEAGVPVAVQLRATFADGSHVESDALSVTIAADTVLRAPASLSDGAIAFGATAVLAFPAATDLSVTFRDRLRRPVDLGRLAAGPARAIAAVLRDPATEAVTPWTEVPSTADEVGPLVGFERLPAIFTDAPAPPAAAAAPLASPAEPKAAQHDFLYYFSLCLCGKPVPSRDFTLTAADGRLLRGRTDRFGMVLVPGLGDATVDFGTGMRQRDRSYSFDPESPESHASLLAALRSATPNDQLTALLDLRRTQLPEARSTLIELMESPSIVAWLNAAVTLSFYDAVDDVALLRLERLVQVAATGNADATTRAIALVGALRRPLSVPALLPWATATDARHRAIAVWALGFIGSGAGLPAVMGALGDEDAAVRTEAALALGRIRADSALGALDRISGDASEDVRRRAQEAAELIVF